MQLIGCELAAFLWVDRLAKLIRGNIYGMRSLTWVHQRNDASAPSGTPWGALEYAISKNLSHTIPNDPSPCLNDSSGMRSANTLVTGKNKQTHPSTWSNLLQLSLPSGRTKFSLTRQREQGRLSPKGVLVYTGYGRIPASECRNSSFIKEKDNARTMATRLGLVSWPSDKWGLRWWRFQSSHDGTAR